MLQQVLTAIGDVFRFHKLKILAVFAFFAMFLVLLFPYDDLNHLVTTKIYDGTNQQLYVYASKLNLSLFPIPGIAASSVSVEPGQKGQRFNPLQFDTIEIRPLLGALLSLRPGASVDASGVFGGEMSVSAKTTNTFFAADPGPITISGFSLVDVSLGKLINYLGVNGLKLGGKLHADSANGIRFDPSGKEPMSGDLELLLESVALPTEIPIPNFGSLSIPSIKVAKADFLTEFAKDKARITKGNFGVERDPLSGRVLGEIGIRQTPQGVQMGAFDLCIELNVNQDFYNKLPKEYASIFEGFKSVTERYRRQEPGMKYGIHASGFSLADVAGWTTAPGDCRNKTAQ